MIRLGMALGVLWVVAFLILLVTAFARLVFDPDENLPDGFTRGQFFLARLTVSALWPLMLFSSFGRGMILYLLKENHPKPRRKRK